MFYKAYLLSILPTAAFAANHIGADHKIKNGWSLIIQKTNGNKCHLSYIYKLF